ncbi:MAG: hypothetical protein KAR18_10835, partial [Spirochaetes bacterium]|nr:hypothetical protein [Spirochaetota bacterium]
MIKNTAKYLKGAIVFSCLHAFFLTVNMLSDQPITYAENNSEKRERYRYEAVPEGSQKASHKKSIMMNINSADSQTIFTMKSVSAKEVEYIRLELDADNNFVSGIRNVTHSSGKPKSEGSILRKQQTVFVERISDKRK